jgi:hypothetical protein
LLAAVAALAVAARGNSHFDDRPPAAAIALLLGMALALMLGSALSHFERRYALPTVPLLTSCGLLAAVGLRAPLRTQLSSTVGSRPGDRGGSAASLTAS